MITPSPRDIHLLSSGPKRILSLDGGGVRGAVTLAFLEQLEALLRARHGRDDLVLSDYFDLIGGTSSGAVIATGLALGKPVGELINLYRTLSRIGFTPNWLHTFWNSKFKAEALESVFRNQLGNTTLGSQRLRTGLAIVAKRIDDGNVWVFNNHPDGPYFDPPDLAPYVVPNKSLRLTELLRASTAAFVDGGVSPHNNPALQMFLLATLHGYRFRWPTGADRMLLVSVGTGYRPLTRDMMPHAYIPVGGQAAHALMSVIDDSSRLVQTVLQYLGRSGAPWPIDAEIGDMSLDHLGAPALQYQRYDMEFSSRWMHEHLGEDVPLHEIRELTAMDQHCMIDALLKHAKRAAENQVKADHLPAGFDLT
jgi:hypothetical protein